jgi:hypothetical protein
MQDIRGFLAYISYLGCVFMEMIACMAATPTLDQQEKLLQVCGAEDHNHIDEILAWYQQSLHILDYRLLEIPIVEQMVLRMLNRTSSDRPLAEKLRTVSAGLRCPVCNKGSEPFEAMFVA